MIFFSRHYKRKPLYKNSATKFGNLGLKLVCKINIPTLFKALKDVNIFRISGNGFGIKVEEKNVLDFLELKR